MTPCVWAAAIIERARKVGPVPRYGDAAWQRLAPTDVRFVAAIAVAAECWRDHCSSARVAADLREQLEAEDRAVVRRVRETGNAVSRAADWRTIAHRPTHAELRRRRGDNPPLTVLPGGAA